MTAQWEPESESTDELDRPGAAGRAGPSFREKLSGAVGSTKALGAGGALLLHLLLLSGPGWVKLVALVAGAGALVLHSDKLVFLTLAISFAAPAANRFLLVEWIEVVGFIDLVSVLALLAYLVLALRYLELPLSEEARLAAMHWDTSDSDAFAFSERRRGPPTSSPFHLWSGVAWRLAASLGIALLLLLPLPLNAMVPNRFAILAAPMRTIVIFWIAMGITFVTLAVLSVARWRRLSPQEAAVYCRAEMLSEIRSELDAVESRRPSSPLGIRRN